MKDLSARELEVLTWTAMGKDSGEIGAILGLAQNTVLVHVANIRKKLEVEKTRSLPWIAMERGLVEPPKRR